jgi:hypothetical protein
MSNSLLKLYIKLISESLVTSDKREIEREDEETVDEFSGVGGITGVVLPLGAEPSNSPRPKLKRKK